MDVPLKLLNICNVIIPWIVIGVKENRTYVLQTYFWSDSYFVTTVSENSLTAVQEYIKNQ